MKIKIALLGLFCATSIHPIYGDQYQSQLEEDEENSLRVLAQHDVDVQKEKKEDKDKPENLIKLGASVSMEPSLSYQDKLLSSKNGLKANLTFKADLPEAWCKNNAVLNIAAGWSGKDFNIKKAAVSIGKFVTMGYGDTIFSYEKADGCLPISVGASVLQIKYHYSVDCFRFGVGVERAVELKVGLFDKNKLEENDEESKDRTNKFDKLDNKKRPFKFKNRFPAVGMNIGIVTDNLNVALNGLGRYSDYTHNTNLDDKNLKTSYYTTCGANLGIQYEVLPKKLTTTLQGVYIRGLGDYVSGLAEIQNEKEREEICSVYYIDKEKNKLSVVDAWGLGGTVECCVAPKWKVSIRGSYLTTLENKDKPAQAFRAQWNIVPKVVYQVNKYFTFSSGYTVAQEFRIDKKKDKAMAHKLSGSIRFSL